MSDEAGGLARLPAGLRAYLQKEPLAALLLGMSSGFPYAMLGATLTTRLAQDGIDKKSVTAFSLAFLVYNFKFLWAPAVDGLRLPLLGRLGQRVSWLVFSGLLVMLAVGWLGVLDPRASLTTFAMAAVAVGFAGATFDIVIDAYRIETLKPEQLGVGSGMSQYGWRIGSVAAGSLALYVATRGDWTRAYLLCAFFALPAMLTGLVLGEPPRRIVVATRRGFGQAWQAVIGPLSEFLQRRGALLGFTIGFENIASGIGGVVVVAYLSALCNLAFTATQFALLSAAASVVGRLVTGTTAGALIESVGYVNFYLLTTLVALPGVLLYVFMLRAGLIERSLGDAGRVDGGG